MTVYLVDNPDKALLKSYSIESVPPLFGANFSQHGPPFYDKKTVVVITTYNTFSAKQYKYKNLILAQKG